MAKGVETNEFSRFVDHTLATPWETFISDIEKSLRLLNKLFHACEKSILIELNMYERELLQLPVVTGISNSSILHDPNFLPKRIALKYLDLEFTIEEFSFGSVGNSNSQSTWIWKLLHFPSFFLFYYAPLNGQEYNLSMRPTILSAFTIAVKAVNELLVPAFFTMEKFDLWDLNSIKDCVGYRPVRLSLTNGTDGTNSNANIHHGNQSPQLPSEDGYWIRYESIMVPLSVSNTASAATKTNTAAAATTTSRKHHPLYYFDGVRKLYQKKLSLINLDYNPQIFDQFLSKIIHHYHFDKKLWITAATSLQNLLNNSHYSGKKSYYILSNPYDYTSSTTLEITMLANYTQKHFIDILTTLLNCGSYNFYLFEHLQVSLAYREGKQHAIIDNEAYSTLLPSKQSHHHWTLLPAFKKANYQLLPMNIYNILYFQWKSICIRRLLSLYILSSLVKFDGFDFHHFYMMANNTNPHPSMKGSFYHGSNGNTPLSASSLGNIFPEHFLLNADQYSSLQELLNRVSKETKYIFGTIFPEEMIYSDKYYQYHQRSHRNSRNTADSGASVSGEYENTNTNTSSSNYTNTASASAQFSFTQEQQYQQLFQQVFQYLFVSKKEGGASAGTTTSSKRSRPTPSTDSFPTEEATTSTTAAAGTGKDQSHSQHHFDLPAMEELPGNKLNAMENWIQAFGILAGLLPLKGPYLLRLWQYCLRELQYVFDSDLSLPWAENSFRINMHMDGNEEDEYTSATAGTVVVSASETQGLYGKSLWSDLLFQKQQRLHQSIALPDIEKPILIQKLMMIFLCIVMKREKVTYEIQTITPVSTLDEEGNPLPPEEDQSYGNPLFHLRNVTLFRRIPVTSDILAMQQHMLKKFQFERSQIDTIVTNHPLLKYQITVPTLLSDIALFKYYNPTVPFAVFYKWYGLEHHPLLGIENIDEWADYLLPSKDDVEGEKRKGVEGIQEEEEEEGNEFVGRPSQANMLLSLETIESEKEIVTLKLLQGLADLYYHQESRSIPEQKPIFSAEKEIGKSIAYLERMSTSSFLLEIIYYSLVFICSFIDQSNSYFQSKQIFLVFIQEKLILLKTQLMKLNLLMEKQRTIIPNIPATSPVPTTTSPSRNTSGTNSPLPGGGGGGGIESSSPGLALPSQRKRMESVSTTDSRSNSIAGGAAAGGGGINSSNPNVNAEVANEEIILLLDSICVIVEELELFYCKLHQLLPMIEVFMNSPFRSSHNSSHRNNSRQREYEEEVEVAEEEEDIEQHREINDNILQLIWQWIEREEDYSCQNMNEVNYIKMMMRTCYNLQQQQQPTTTSTTSNTTTTTTTTTTTNNNHSSPVNTNISVIAETLASSSPARNAGKHRSQANSLDQLRKESQESGEKTPTMKSIDSSTSLPPPHATTTSQQDHDWYSYDGRELPSLPSSKDFHLFASARYPVKPASSSSTTVAEEAENPSHSDPTQMKPIQLEFTEVSSSSTAAATTSTAPATTNHRGANHKSLPISPRGDRKHISEFSMTVSTDGTTMRMIHEILEIN